MTVRVAYCMYTFQRAYHDELSKSISESLPLLVAHFKHDSVRWLGCGDQLSYWRLVICSQTTPDGR